MADPIPASWKRIWEEWDLRWFVILSLSLQTILILFAPLRKRSSSNWIIMPLWSSYLLADWAANFAVGLISNSQGDSAGDKEDLLAFWAPFLLVHLGGPDTITAFALEDNELWLRHLFGLLFQCVAAIYIFLLSFPRNKLWIPTLLMFVTGILKYAERTRSLYLASADNFKESMLTEPDPGPNYAKLMDEYFSKKEARLPTKIEMIPEPNRAKKAANRAKQGKLTELEVVQYANGFFETFKGLVVDLIFSFCERDQSRAFFLARDDEDAFKVLEAELNFIYEVLFTKLTVVYSLAGCLSRIVSLGSLFFALWIFYFVEKHIFSVTDVRITYSLLLGAIVLDLVALLMLLVSDWTIVALKKSPETNAQSSFNTFLNKFLTFKRRRSLPFNTSQNFCLRCLVWPVRVFRRRWSESIGTYNLIYYCLHHRSKFMEIILGYFGLTGFFDDITYVKLEEFSLELRGFIFEELKAKSDIADDLETAKEISSARGNWVLRIENGWSSLHPYIVEVNYDESLLLWHIATELCYSKELKEGVADSKYRRICKLLSDYMIYLLVMQPNMMSAVAGIGQIRFRDTCAEAKKFFHRGKLKEESRKGAKNEVKGDINGKREAKSDSLDEKQIEACTNILGVFTEVKPVTIKGDRSKSVLFDACILAKKMKSLEENDKNLDKWKLMSKMWVELLSYAACHCRANAHAQQLSNGGELITFIWLLMAHFGLGDQFQINEGHARAKLIVGK